MKGERCSNCGDGTLDVYDPEGYPVGTFPGNYTCDKCEAVFQVPSETRAALEVAAERESIEELLAKLEVHSSQAHDLSVEIRQLETEIERRRAEGG